MGGKLIRNIQNNFIFIAQVSNHKTRDVHLIIPNNLCLIYLFNSQNYGNYLSYFWANHNGTRDALGIKKDSKKEWVRCHEGDLPYSRDIESSIKYHRNVTLKGYRSLVYSGDHDAVVPLTGTQAWVRSLNFSVTHDWRAWHLHGQSAGFTIAYSNNLTFATVKLFVVQGGGHTAPEFQPERCLAMFRRWISGNPL
ncbi:hypothetical protein PR202_gb29307 [Eleusine coracana subsp. coracana]|uniref:Uncharacterized protein n=1 Tax=Eleusine coracana subsp. coracana TaxID=191504 RepID=A0AAV5FWV8_ELECO|nr:hypothetical protein PR202_gb29307 [Eleusine coracana subsp. coracana]